MTVEGWWEQGRFQEGAFARALGEHLAAAIPPDPNGEKPTAEEIIELCG